MFAIRTHNESMMNVPMGLLMCGSYCLMRCSLFVLPKFGFDVLLQYSFISFNFIEQTNSHHHHHSINVHCLYICLNYVNTSFFCFALSSAIAQKLGFDDTHTCTWDLRRGFFFEITLYGESKQYRMNRRRRTTLKKTNTNHIHINQSEMPVDFHLTPDFVFYACCDSILRAFCLVHLQVLLKFVFFSFSLVVSYFFCCAVLTLLDLFNNNTCHT